MPRTIVLLLAGALALGGGAAQAGDITVTVHVRESHHDHHRRHAVPAWVPPSGPQIYYSYYPDHVPAYPDHMRGVPVPIFPTSRPPRIANSVPTVPYAHIDWCASRYATYRLWDNTYQPYYGPRRQCLSPYR